MRVLLYIISFLILFSCKKDETVPNKLIGKWTDENTSYAFTPEKTYSTKYLRTGALPDTVVTDSIWGTYSYETSSENVSFLVKGIKYRKSTKIGTDSIANVNYNGPTWNISFEGNDVLKYRSNTSLGYLKRTL
jgi:hypothetical protein